MQYVHEIASAPTSTYLSVLDAAGDMQVAINDMSIVERLGPDQLRPQKAMLRQSSLIIVDCNLASDALAWLTRTFSSIPLFVDTVSAAKARRIKPHLQAVHTLKASASEVETLTGRPASTKAQLRAVAQILHAEGVQRLFITRGAKGVFYSTPDEQDFASPLLARDKVRSTGGAGDAFVAGLAYAWLKDWPLDRTLRFALTAADITLASPATSSPALSVSAITRAMGAGAGG